MENGAGKTKLITNSADGMKREIKIEGQKLGTVASFTYLGVDVLDDGLNRKFSEATAALKS